MAIPNNYIDKIKNKDSGESRVISPAADNVRVDNENFEGTDLDEVLDEVAQAIDEAGSGDGTVTGVKVGSTTYEPTEGVVDLSTPFAGKVDKNGTDSLMTAAEHTKLAGIEAGAEVNVINGIKANGASETLPVENGIVTLPPAGSTISPATAAPVMDGTANVGSSAKYAREDHVHPHDTTKLSQSDVSVETQGDGTVDINVGNDTYTINLNHTHDGMAKIVKCTEATLPQTLENDTIYVQVDNATTPTEIECLYLFGLEFTGGGLPAGVPQISKPTPNSTINLGTAYGQGGATGTVKIKGRSLTANSTVVVSVSSGFSLSYGQQSGSSVNIDAADAILGADVDVIASAYGTSGTILITSQTDSLSVEANLTSDVVEDLAGVKLTGTQWLQTDYKPNDKTEFTMDVKFTPNSHTEDYPATGSGVLLRSQTNSIDGKEFALYLGGRNSQSVPKGAFMLLFKNESTVQYGSTYQWIRYTSDTNAQEYLDFIVDHSTIQYEINSSNGKLTFSNTSTNKSCNTSKKTSTMEDGMMIGKNETEGILTRMDFTIYSLEIREQGNVVRRYTAKRLNGIPHLYEEITGTFLRSETAKVSGLAADELVAVTED